MFTRSTPVRVRRPRRSIAVVMMVGLALVLSSAVTAGASEFQPKPFLSILSGCENHVFHYRVLMYNQGNDWTTYTVSSQIGNAPQTLAQHDVAAYDLVMLDFVVPETTMGTFHVTNPDSPVVDDLRSPTADCIADPNSSVMLVCPEGDGSPFVRYEWVNTSYASAHFVLGLPDGSTVQHDHSWFDHEQLLEVPVVENSHAVAWIAIDGVIASSIDETVDCVLDPPVTTSTTVPSTTTSTTTTSTTTTVPSTTTSTTSTTVPKPTSTTATSTTSTTVPKPTSTTSTTTSTTSVAVVAGTSDTRPTIPPTVPSTRPTAVAGVSALAVTGSASANLGLVGLGLLLLGLAAWLLSERRRVVA